MWNDLIGGAADRQRERATPSHGSFCFSTSYLLSGFEYETNDFLDFKQLVSVKKNIYIYIYIRDSPIFTIGYSPKEKGRKAHDSYILGHGANT